MSHWQPGYVLAHQVPPTSSSRSNTTKSSNPDCLRRIAIPRPPNPAPRVATRKSRRSAVMAPVYIGVPMSVQPESTLRAVLPRGRHAAPRPVVREVQRARMLDAMVHAVAEKGYARVVVADVIERAGVSRKTFYEQFSNKEDCFLAAYDAGGASLAAGMAEGLAPPAPDWLAGAGRAVEAYLDQMAASPAFARAFLIEALGAGPAALERRDVVQQRFAAQLEAIQH